jgi:hypothetical protein
VIAEAIDTVWTLGWALFVWFVLCAVFATLALYTLAVAVWWPCRAAREGVAGALAASQALRALHVHLGHHRPTDARVAHPCPSWAQPDKEAA